MGIQQILFLLLLIIVLRSGAKSYGRIWKAIHLGKSDSLSEEHGSTRWKRVLLIAFGQKKMFKKPLVALMHGAIYVAFLFTQVELIEILIDGVFGVHRFFAPFLGQFYTVIISTVEILSILALTATLIFLIRRNVLKIKRCIICY